GKSLRRGVVDGLLGLEMRLVGDDLAPRGHGGDVGACLPAAHGHTTIFLCCGAGCQHTWLSARSPCAAHTRAVGFVAGYPGLVTQPTPRPTVSRVYLARLKGTAVFDPLGDQVGRVHDGVVIMRLRGAPRAVGLVVEVSGKRRVFLPLTRVTNIDAGAVITTGLLNIRRFEQRATETLVVGQLLDRQVTFRDGSGGGTVQDVAMEQQRNRDWHITKV